MTAFDIDVSGLDALARELAEVGGSVMAEVRPVVAKGALNIKTTMRDDLAKSAHFGQVARSVTYDTKAGQSFASAEIGPVTAGQTVGDLAHFAYFGGANGGGGTVRDPQEALNEESPRFVDAVSDVIDRLLRG